MRGIGGFASHLSRVNVPRSTLVGLPSQTTTLEEFAATLDQGQLRAVVVDSTEISIEGRFWLCNVLGRASQATEQQARATELFEKDWWIVQIMWYRREGQEGNKYKLLPDSTRWLAVNAIIRVDGLQFDGGQRASRTGIRVLSERSRELIEACMP